MFLFRIQHNKHQFDQNIEGKSVGWLHQLPLSTKNKSLEILSCYNDVNNNRNKEKYNRDFTAGFCGCHENFHHIKPKSIKYEHHPPS